MCAVAALLSEDPANRVLVLVAGLLIPMIIFISQRHLSFCSTHRWTGITSEPQTALNRGILSSPRGTVFKGSTSIKAMIYYPARSCEMDPDNSAAVDR